MKNYSMQSTDDNVFQAFIQDSIQRSELVLHCMQIIDAVEGETSIAIDSPWGTGKTFFAKQLKLMLDYNNSLIDIGEEKTAKIEEYLLRHVKNEELKSLNKTYVTFYYDAWINDNTEDPIKSLIFEMLVSKNVVSDGSRRLQVKKIVASLATALTGRDWNTLIDALEKEDLLEDIRKQKNIDQLLSEIINEILVEHGDRIVIIVDELDRCKPDYAVRFLERIKHYFYDDRLIFVFAINTGQLKHTIKKYYGEDFDSARYLDKFFDFKIPLPEVPVDINLRRLGVNNTSYNYDHTVKAVLKYMNFSMRETEKFLRNTQLVEGNAKGRRYYGFGEENAIGFGLMYFVPILIGLQIRDSEAYNDFLNGKRKDIALDILQSEIININHDAFIFGENEDVESMNEDSIKTRIEEVYNGFFKRNHNDWEGLQIGKMNISSESTKYVIKTASLLSSETELQKE